MKFASRCSQSLVALQILLAGTSLALAQGKEVSPDSSWHTMKVPGCWEDDPTGRFNKLDGFAWYRCQVELPASWKSANLELFVEKMDNAHEVFFNGQPIGGSGGFPPQYEDGLDSARRYPIGPALLKPGAKNAIAIRVYDAGGRGGFKGTAPALFNERSAIDLTGDWQFRPGDDRAWAGIAADDTAPVALFSRVDSAAEIAPRVSDFQRMKGALSPAESADKFIVDERLEFEQLLAEPTIAQPLFLNFDERGRMWVVEYRQYPHPAGLEMVSRDNYWRAVYDRVPAAPPNHTPGRDRISIHEDTNGDGRFDKHSVFLDGLNITTSVARGRGGVWVLNPPYLLFYPDKDNDDRPDGDPIVHLAGFGIEDTHSVTNSLRFGPDGWLYASQGSTVTGAMRRPGIDEKPFLHTMGQLIWRYHPESRRFEVFAEGGGNAFGCEIDSKGRVFSGHNGGNTRGFHYVQGGYLRKGFDKHGELSNPYAFGFFDAIKHHDVPRFSHNFLLYEGAAFPEEFRGQLFGVEPLQGQVVYSSFQTRGATFETRDVSRPVKSDDSWFRPVDIKLGPDGGIYIADWYDGQVNHYRNHEGKFDPESGRVYRLQARGAKPIERFDLGSKSTQELVDVLAHPNRWFRQTALRLIGDRHDASLAPLLRERLAASDGQLALELFWALHLSAGLSETDALTALAHRDPYVRLWSARLIGDDNTATGKLAKRMAELAAQEPHLEVRSQLASTAKRLPAKQALPIVRALASRSEDTADPYIPLLLWWAIEAHVEADRDAIVAMFADADFWQLTLVRSHLLERTMRRFAQAGARPDLLTCAQLLQLAPDEASAKILLDGFEKAFQGRSLAVLPDELAAALAKWGGGSLALRVRRGEPKALHEAIDIISDQDRKPDERIQLIELFGQTRPPHASDLLLNAAGEIDHPDVSRAAVAALGGFGDREFNVGDNLVDIAAKAPEELRHFIFLQLAGRRDWANSLIRSIDNRETKKEDVPPAAIRRLLLHDDAPLAAAVRKHWGSVAGETTAATQQEIARLSAVINGDHGSPYAGKKLFAANCGKCHTLFNEGGRVGPDLTAFRRDDLPAMLLAIANPSAEVREGYEQFLIATEDGRALSGLVDESDNQIVLLRTADGRQLAIPRDEIEVMRPLGQSLMPEGALKALNDRQIRDLFAYLRSTQPLNN